MHQYLNPKLTRFSKASKPLLVDYINKLNNRAYTPEQFVFGTPTLLNDSGLSQVEIGFAASTGWDTARRTLTYNRVDLNLPLGEKPIVVHTEDDSPAGVLRAIYQQYGLLIEAEHVEMELVTSSFYDHVRHPDLPGFDIADLQLGIPEIPEAPHIPEYLNNKNYRMVFKPTHLIFFGELQVLTRRSLDLLGTTIDSLMDLRDFYKDGNFDKPPVDLYLPSGELLLTDDLVPYVDRRHYESQLHIVMPDSQIAVGSILPKVLRKLTGDPWTATPEHNVDFNLFGAKVLHNGFVSKNFHCKDPAFNYLLAVDLNDRCANLSGVLKLGYRYSDSKTPGNLPYDRSAAPSIIGR